MVIQRRDDPVKFGSLPMGAYALVASTTPSRLPRSALPTISSDSPDEYTSAVSMKLIPASNARWMMRTESSWSGLPHSPNIMAPRHSGLTLTPVRPSARIFTMQSYPKAQGPLVTASTGSPASVASRLTFSPSRVA